MDFDLEVARPRDEQKVGTVEAVGKLEVGSWNRTWWLLLKGGGVFLRHDDRGLARLLFGRRTFSFVVITSPYVCVCACVLRQ